MVSFRSAQPANPVELARRPSRRTVPFRGHPLTYRGHHRARRRVTALVAVTLCAGLPASVALGAAARQDAPRPASAQPQRPATRLAPPLARPPLARASRSRAATAVRVAAPVSTQRRLTGYLTRVEQVDGRSFTGRATWYGPGFHGRTTANGERFNQMAMTAAHRTLPFGTRLRVCTRRRCVTVRVNDRGPFGPGNVLDLSKGAARRLGTEYAGVARITATVVRTRTVKEPVYAPAPPRPQPVLAAAAVLRAERLSRPHPNKPAGSAAQPAAPGLELVRDERSWSPLTTIAAVLGALLLLGAMALPAIRHRRRRGLSFIRER